MRRTSFSRCIHWCGRHHRQDRAPLIDWLSPVAGTYYSRDVSRRTRWATEKTVSGASPTVWYARRELNLTLTGSLPSEDSLHQLAALKSTHRELQAITATSSLRTKCCGQTRGRAVLWSTALQAQVDVRLLRRIAYLLYQQHTTLTADQVYLFTPNEMFSRYINTVLYGQA